ncbi:hypothetical protein VKT23_013884 [Stygiomarasmius scandens]|uniref:Uncharacterized protein n=1 Tax=Marasmiellus scandens TaxID=2682957 RepID=A0ABR1J6R0_9AGAR
MPRSLTSNTLSFSSPTSPPIHIFSVQLVAMSTPPMASDDCMFGLDDLDDVTLSPPHPKNNSRKRKQGNNSQDTGTSEQNLNPTTTNAVNINVITAAKRLACSKKLRPEQIIDLEQFLNDSAIGREAKMLILNVDLSNKIDKILVSQQAWEPSDSLKKNIKHYVAATTLSTSILSYLARSNISVVVEKLLSLSLDLPKNIRQDASVMQALTHAVEYAFTQRRSDMKKVIRSSVTQIIKAQRVSLPEKECMNIVQLTQALVKGTRCGVTAPLCACVAILRHAYILKPGDGYWGTVDSIIEGMRKKGDYNKEAIAELVRKRLKKDRSTYGVDDYQIQDEPQTEIQNEMEQLVTTRNLSPEDEDDQGSDGEGDGTDAERDGQRNETEKNLAEDPDGSDGDA